MRRRNFIKVIVGSAAAWPLMAHAQQLCRVPTVGILWHAGSVAEEAIYLAQIQQGLQVLGYAEGRNITLVNTFADEQYERFNSNAVELVRRGVDVIIAVTLPAALAAQRATNPNNFFFVFSPTLVAQKFCPPPPPPGENFPSLAEFSAFCFAKIR